MTFSLDKATEQVVLTLNKRGITDIPKDINVSLLLDISGSMTSEYHNGRVANVLRRLLSISNTIDDDGQMELVLFHNNAYHYGTITTQDFDNVDTIIKNILNKYSFCGTEFAPAIDKILEILSKNTSNGFLKNMFSKSKKVEGKQLLVMISDGSNSDTTEFNRKIKTLEELPNLYLQCVSVGYSSNYLENIADQSDSVGYSSLSDFSKTDGDLIDAIINPELLKKFSTL